MQPKMRILSFHHIPNNGAFLFAYSLLELLQQEFGEFDVKILDYKSNRLAIYEYLKRFKFFQKIPLFYMRRARIWKEHLKIHLNMDSNFPHFTGEKALQKYFSNQYAALVVGMDTWCIINGTERPKFPNIYWLPEKISIPKIAYGVSAYHSDINLIQNSTKKIESYLNSFDIIGARDRYTYELVQKYRSRDDGLVEMIPDPTFTYEIKTSGVLSKLQALGIDMDRPTLGLLFFGDNFLSNEILSHYKAKGYQILAMSMYNAVADYNLGHILSPFEWAEAFRYLSFCISDRFHGTIFCLLNQIPFICLEKERHLPKKQSKIYDLLTTFGLETCYQNPADEGFEIVSFLAHADEIEATWEKNFKSGILPRIDDLKDEHAQFARKMKVELGWI
ncbi:MAG: polysaccharide pyruvyl transferase family protein [Chloroflexi bacterium]|nr:polysaccharide pyruvyl transferase family protein [Chloroflexota bacterium]